jgi:hypothetical protein
VKDEKTGDMLRLHVKYERIPKFYRYCGHVGHVEKDCLLPKKEQKVRFGLHLHASPKKFVASSLEQRDALAKRGLNFDGQDDDRRQDGNNGKGKEMNKDWEKHGASKSATSDAAAGTGQKGYDVANDIARKVLMLGVHDTPTVLPPLVF